MSSPSPAEIAVEQERCLQLKLDGLTVRAIAAETGLPPTTVHRRLQDAMTELVAPVAAEVRLVEARLDRWQVKLERRIDAGEPAEKIIPVGLQVQARRAKYLGLDAPERSEVQVDVPEQVTGLLDRARTARETGGAA